MNNQKRDTTAVLDRTEAFIDEPIRSITGRSGGGVARLRNIGKKSAAVGNNVIGKTKDYWRNTNGYVGRNPWVAVGVSAGFAFLAGMFIGRRKH